VYQKAGQTSIVIYIYKGKGNGKTDPSSYTPISLLSIISKLWEKVILRRVNSFLTLNSPKYQQQGFQHNLSCLTTAFALHETVLYHIGRHCDVYGAGLEQKVAFDTVRFRALFLKLGRFGLTGQFLRLAMSLYENLKSVIRTSVSTSAPIMVKRSARQGGVLSTFLYLVYMNVLWNDIQSSGCGTNVMSIWCGNPTFADDISLFALTPLQKMVDIIFRHYKQWNVLIIVENSSVAVFTKSRSQPSVILCMVIAQSIRQFRSSGYFLF